MQVDRIGCGFAALAMCCLLDGALADEAIDRTGAWDVNAPLGESAEFRLTTDAGTWMNVDVHPDGERVVFDLLGDLYVLPIDGGEASQLTSGAAYDIQAGSMNQLWPREVPRGDFYFH